MPTRGPIPLGAGDSRRPGMEELVYIGVGAIVLILLVLLVLMLARRTV